MHLQLMYAAAKRQNQCLQDIQWRMLIKMDQEFYKVSSKVDKRSHLMKNKTKEKNTYSTNKNLPKEDFLI